MTLRLKFIRSLLIKTQAHCYLKWDAAFLLTVTPDHVPCWYLLRFIEFKYGNIAFLEDVIFAF